MGRLDRSGPEPEARVIWLRREAPEKPSVGMPCNGCGVCCAVAPCPVALVFLHQPSGSCRALQWDEASRQYRCGMALQPRRYLRWLPAWSARTMQNLVLRWIAAGTACDAENEIADV